MEIQANKPNQTPHLSTTTEEHYFHKQGNELFRDDTPTPRWRSKAARAITCFVRVLPDGRLFASYAHCDRRDQFSRKLGRSISRRKWFAGKRVQVAEATYECVFSAVYEEYTTDIEDAHLFIG